MKQSYNFFNRDGHRVGLIRDSVKTKAYRLSASPELFNLSFRASYYKIEDSEDRAYNFIDPPGGPMFKVGGEMESMEGDVVVIDKIVGEGGLDSLLFYLKE